ncbi:SDR family oxidoreductase [Pseudogemmobacter sonorensis]|uniref:SDR family oxidoreductase n=1 Tax=Pseudogemmobacter sonorensis TaxID=2989681 RepID=UPI0036A7627F
MSATGIGFGFIGIGDMGGPMAERMAAGGIALVVHDRAAEAMARLVPSGARAAASVEELAAGCDVVFTCLPKPEISLAVARQIARAPDRRARVVVEMSTVGVEAVRAIQAELAQGGVALVDGPVSGGPKAVAAGKLTCMVSGPAAAVELALPALEVLAGRIFRLGESVGTAQAMKVGNNLLAAANLALTGEVVRMVEKAGIAPATAIEVINASTGRNRASEELYPRQVLTGSFAQGARLDILAKDTGLAVAAAQSLGAAFPMGQAIRATWDNAAAAGFGAQDITAIYRFLGQRRAQAPEGPAPEFKGKTAVITGGNRGIGRAIALAFAREGANVVISGRDGASIAAVVEEIRALGGGARGVAADLAEISGAETLARAVSESFGAADVVVTSAGIRDHADQSIDAMDPALYDAVTRGNILTTVLPIRALLPAMIARREGRIVTISGVFGLRGRARHAAGVSAKWAIEGFMRSLAIECGPHNINANSVCPGYVLGARSAAGMAAIAEGRGIAPEEVRAELEGKTLLGRLSTEADIAGAVLFLSGPRARNITGQDLVVDGGWSAL